jgi:hypothetical protein
LNEFVEVGADVTQSLIDLLILTVLSLMILLAGYLDACNCCVDISDCCTATSRCIVEEHFECCETEADDILELAPASCTPKTAAQQKVV